MTPAQGEIWWAEAEDKRRPVLVVTRSDAVPILLLRDHHRTRHAQGPGYPHRGPPALPKGLTDDCVASFDNLQPIRRGFLTERVGQLGVHGRQEMCRALQAFSDC